MRLLEASHDAVRIFSERPFGYKRFIVEYEDGRVSIYSGLWYKLTDIQDIVENEIDNRKI